MRKSSIAHLLLALLGLAALACSASEVTERTQIVMTVDSDLRVPSEIDRLRIEIRGGKAPVAEADLKDRPLPRTLGLSHGGGPLGPITIKVSGLLGSTTVVERELVTSFVKNRTSLVSVELESACKNVFCEEGTTCVGGVCRGIPVVDPDPDPEPDGGMDLGPDGGGGGDAGDGDGDGDGGTGGAPTCKIDLPAEGDVYQTGKTLPLQGSCSDPESGALSSVEWRSDVDGLLGAPPRLTSAGPHVLSLCATDPKDASVKGCDSVTIEASHDMQPAVGITSLTQDGSSTQPFSEDQAIQLIGTASGAGVTVSWTDSLQGDLGDSTTETLASPIVGRHTLTLTATDRSGATASASVTYVVLADGETTLVGPFAALNETLTDAGGATVLRLGADAAGRGYAATEQSELYRFTASDPSADGSVAVDNPPLAGNVRDIFVAEDAALAYLATADGLTVCNYLALTGIGQVCTSYQGSDLPSDSVRSVLRMTATDDEEYLLIGTADGLLIADSVGGSDQGTKKLEGTSINAMVASSGVAWLATDNGLYRINPSNDSSLFHATGTGAPSTVLSGVAVDGTGLVWVASNNGLGRFTAGMNRWRIFRTADGLPSNQLNDVAVHHVTIDDVERDVVWVATDGGASRLDPVLGTFMTLGTTDGLPNAKVLDVLVLASGTKLFATDAGVARYLGP